MTESISAAHLDSFDVPGTKAKVIGRAERFLAAGDLPNGNGSIDLDLELVVPKKVETPRSSGTR